MTTNVLPTKSKTSSKRTLIRSPSRHVEMPGICRVADGDEAQLIRAIAGEMDGPVVCNMPGLTRPGLEKIGMMASMAGVENTRAFGDFRVIAYHPENTTSIAESLEAHPPHTDGTFVDFPPAKFMLYFEKTDTNGGGISTFLNGADLLAKLEPEYTLVLARGKARFARADKKGFVDAWEGSLLSQDKHGKWMLRWRYDQHVRPAPVDDNTGLLAEAIERFYEICRAEPPMEYRAIEGDLLIVPNHTWLHGRTELSPDSPRCVIRAWLG